MATPKILVVLYRWKDWSNQDEPRLWLAKAIKADAELLTFLERTRKRILTQGGSDPTTRVRFEVGIPQLEPFIDLRTLSGRSTKLLETRNELTDQQREMLRQVIDGVEQFGSRANEQGEGG